MLPQQLLAKHWPEYLIEAWGLGILMVAAGTLATVLFSTASPVHQAIPNPFVQQVLMGLGMGLTVFFVVSSPWGRRSGAHFNPAVTLTFYQLGKVKAGDALFYSLFQVLGGLAGVLLVRVVFGQAFTAQPVQYVVTVPGKAGIPGAVLAELLVATVTMFVVQVLSNQPRLAPITPKVVALLVMGAVIWAAPYSGFSTNPARTIASALPAGVWTAVWLYLMVPTVGMVLGAQLYLVLYSHRSKPVRCGKLWYDDTTPCGRSDGRGTTRCIFCEDAGHSRWHDLSHGHS
ncbi:pore-forming membrane protein MIP family channel protein [Gloeomargarita lithophora Alchichica-D10]|uniref:Pore-forming membrane protein MIP family channel protein n=1 Tax=Gloeomargarita lithophora Alchichica-D10 TaxID=1188229 RepID=A0A1J0AA22_9CYAN|nr:aquaporin [Gloeomargarita lithophora]APB32757.1 pore-forming membrane protein MIP family channel protein [Gloeomargarita lithophora Alchichica-D10]